jgi:two-component system response regulator
VPIDVLLVEDDPADELITREAFEHNKIGNTLHVVRDGEEALDFLYRRGAHADAVRPDLILLDLNLPGMTGREVLERIRNTPALRTVPVLVLTTSRRQEDVHDMYAAGANTYIEKPQDFRQFVEVLRTVRHYWLDTALLPPG